MKRATKVQCMSCGKVYSLRKGQFRPCPKCNSTAIHFKVYAASATIAILLTLCGCSLRHGWAPSNYRHNPLPPDRIECWQPGEHWSEKGQACHDVRGERDGNKELP